MKKLVFSTINHEYQINIPVFKPSRYGDWVKWGENNDFGNTLLSLYNNSSIHSSIVESKVRMISGDGIEQTGVYSERTQSFIDKPNPQDTLYDILFKITNDFEIFGLAYLEIIWDKSRTYISEIYQVDANKVRWGIRNNKGLVDKFYFSNDWSKYRREIYSPEAIPIFNTNNRIGRQILPLIRYTPSLDYYSYPDYISGLKWITIDSEISNYHYNNLKNGMAPTLFFQFPVSESTPEEREEIETALHDKFTGTNNASKFFTSFYDAESTNKPEVKILEMSNADKQFNLLIKSTLQQILIAHKVTNENLVGISTPGKLGTGGELLDSYKLYHNTIIKPEQKKIINIFKRLFLINGMNDIEINDMDFKKEEFSKRVITKNNVNEINNSILNDKYIWRSSRSDDTCPACKSFDGQVRKMSEWINIAIPGVVDGQTFQDGIQFKSPHGSGKYGTYCEKDCHCKLVKI
jgi:hypothetical protein